jgi:hypothetical protein
MRIDDEFFRRIRAAKACVEGVEYTRQFVDTADFWQACNDPAYMLWWWNFCGKPDLDRVQAFLLAVAVATGQSGVQVERVACGAPHDVWGGGCAILETAGKRPEHADLFREMFGVPPEPAT